MKQPFIPEYLKQTEGTLIQRHLIKLNQIQQTLRQQTLCQLRLFNWLGIRFNPFMGQA